MKIEEKTEKEKEDARREKRDLFVQKKQHQQEIRILKVCH